MSSLVSVIIRSVERPELLEALASLARQTYPDIEVILVDAVGVHAAPATCWPFPIRLVSRGEPLIRSRAANLGLDQARGRYLIFLDDDDLFLPDHVARLVAALQSQPGARAAYGGVRVEGDEGVIDVYDADFDPCRLIAWNHLPTASVMIARSLVEDGVRFDEALDLYEDWDFWLQVSALTPLVRSPGISAVWRPHLGRSGMIDPERQAEQAVARRYVQEKWLRRLPPEGFERLILSFRRDIAERDARLAEAAHREDDLRAQERGLRDQERELWRMLKGERKERLAWRREARAAMAELREQHEVREAAERAVEALRGELALLRASTSWRLTAPLRRAADLIRRRPGV